MAIEPIGAVTSDKMIDALLFAKSLAQSLRYVIGDNFYNCWFRFIAGHSAAVELGAFDQLRAPPANTTTGDAIAAPPRSRTCDLSARGKVAFIPLPHQVNDNWRRKILLHPTICRSFHHFATVITSVLILSACDFARPQGSRLEIPVQISDEDSQSGNYPLLRSPCAVLQFIAYAHKNFPQAILSPLEVVDRLQMVRDLGRRRDVLADELETLVGIRRLDK